jgi:O-antigen biosynthesis protein
MALEDHFKRLGQAVEILPVPGDHWRIKYPLPSPAPFVSLIVPDAQRAQAGAAGRPEHPGQDRLPGLTRLIIVDNASDDPETIAYLGQIQGDDPRVRVMSYREPFNYSAINNHAVREARGEVIGLLNNDVEAIDRRLAHGDGEPGRPAGDRRRGRDALLSR